MSGGGAVAGGEDALCLKAIVPEALRAMAADHVAFEVFPVV